MIPVTWYLALSIILFSIGMYGFLTRRNVIIMFLCIELMLNAANLNFVAFSHYLTDLHGQVMTFFIIAVAAAEAAIGLGIVLALFRNRRTVYSDEINQLRG
ncbi:MAG: NADH-quinone oxidoreductase subunit NuoK [Desulfobulbaceae bacterium]|uniref:NADH-quinone oxidoreductase subunit K n=1 Tax=Candidatus Desulfobia pelagia TaxID=2841692 RepID=A0A8J6NDW4_9BACT|nr:NADH-quinone oxidoreductase subunit NuoK [Candidatus Desulfobia pelagia]